MPFYTYLSEIQIRQKLDFLDSVRMAEDPYWRNAQCSFSLQMRCKKKVLA